MRFAVAIQIAFKALGRNGMRTVLTMLGIVIGIAAVICTIAIGEGGSGEIQRQLLALGDNFVWVEAGSRNVGGVRTGAAGNRSLTVDDMKAIEESIPVIKSCTPQVDARAQVVYGNQNWSTTYRGVSPEYLNIRRWHLSRGTAFSEEDVDTHATLCILGQTVADKLFGEEDPIGQTIRVRYLLFKVVGVLKPKGHSATGNDQDDFVLIPYTTAQRKIKGIWWLDDVMCSAVSMSAVQPAKDQIASLLRQRHRLSPEDPDDFNIQSPEDALNARAESNRILALMIASVGSISLLVGGIGIMNVMLVSVVERTREIGVRMATGATELDVQLQFISEAVALSLAGGGIGTLAGILASRGLSRVLEWPTLVSPQAVGIAVLFSAVTGIFFGYYPARKASRLDPIEALRFE